MKAECRAVRAGSSLSMARISCLILLFATVAVALPPKAVADGIWKQSESIWQLMDTCNRQAHQQYPDYTREGKAKRETYRQTCMRANNLPFEGGVTPPLSTLGLSTPLETPLPDLRFRPQSDPRYEP